MTSTEKTVRYSLKINGYTVDHADRIPGLYLDNGCIATITDLVDVLDAQGVKGLIALLNDSALIHG